MSKTCVAAAGLYCGLGMAVPIIPTVAGITAVLLVRTVLWNKKKTFVWNVAITLLTSLATFATLEGRESSTFVGFWIGMSYGGMGQGIIAIGRTSMASTMKDRFGKAMEVFLGAKPDKPE